MGIQHRWHSIRPALTIALALIASLVFVAQATAAPPRPGAPGVGDRLFPTLGNGGYDAGHYHLDMTYPTADPEQTVDGEVTMIARATQSLSSFNLDFAGDSVESVRVNGLRANWTRDGNELVITPRKAIKDRHRLVATVDFTSGPYVPPDPDVDPFPFGWFTTADGSVTAGQPDQSQTIYPVNDHPSDKASYSFRLDVPEGITAVANGVQLWSKTRGGRTVSYYLMREPMASELIQLAVGDLTVVDRGRTRGVHLRDVAPSTLAATFEPRLATTPNHFGWMVDRVGRYPFDTYGVLAANQFFGYALETQTLSLHPGFIFEANYPAWAREPIMVHELAHQWFGDSVAPRVWSDLWLNEGHATWYEWLYGDEFFRAEIAENLEVADFTDRVRQAYAQGDIWRDLYGPVAQPASNELFELFSPNVYDGGAVALYALRQEIGERAFAVLERRWVQANAGDSVGTSDFIALASRVAGRNLGPFLRDWLYGTETPPMPGHPDWEVLPVEAAPPAATVAKNQALRIERSILKR
jgi:aminopeptidase N